MGPTIVKSKPQPLFSFLLAPVLLACVGGAPTEALPSESGPVAAQSDADGSAEERIARVPNSMLVSSKFFDDEWPETRSLRHILIQFNGALGASREVERSREEAREFAAELRERISNGADFGALAQLHSGSSNASNGGVLGTFHRGVLAPALDEFLFTSELGDVSEPLTGPRGVHILERVERRAACRQILLAGPEEEARKRLSEIEQRLAAGASFADLAREFSDHEASAERGGALGIFERGPSDALLKRAAFQAQVGEIVGPISSPLGLHLVKRVPIDELDPELEERNWFRGRAVLISWGGAPEMPFWIERTAEESKELAEQFVQRLEAGEDFSDLAAEFNDDPGGKERGADLGWLHRRSPSLPNYLRPLGARPVGEFLGPVPVPAGWVIAERTR